tara:strand:+ start:1316 stop:1459 length:144 start_codon:yes stop_codon:yes gene_type:complete
MEPVPEAEREPGLGPELGLRPEPEPQSASVLGGGVGAEPQSASVRRA